MKSIKTLFTLTLVSLLIACGGEKEKKEEKPNVTIGSQKEAKKEDGNSITLALSGNDMMQFDKKEFTVKAGQKVTLNFRHTGKMDLAVMGHNFVLLKPGTEINVFAAAAANAGKPKDWIPNHGEEVIAHTKMLGGGQRTSITFTAPEAGIYDFICSFSGHSGLMRGKFNVE